MKKTLLVNALLVGMVSYAAAATLVISNTSTGVLSGLQKNDGTQGSLIWGVVVDTGGDGFQGNSTENLYDGGFFYRPTQTGGTYTGTTSNTGQILSTVNAITKAVTVSNDVLFLSVAGMLGTAYSNDGGTNVANSSFRPSQIASINFGTNGVAASQAFAVIWFDLVNIATGASATLGTTSVDGTYYGMVTNAMATAAAGTDLLLPAAQSGSTDVNSSFLGAESARPAGFQLGAVPEPSAALLGALGALGLLRRRRN